MALNTKKVFDDDDDGPDDERQSGPTIEVEIPNREELLPSVTVNDGTQEEGDDRQGDDPYSSAIEEPEKRTVGRTARQRARQREARDRSAHELQYLRNQVENLTGIVGNFGQNQIAVAISNIEGRMMTAKNQFERAEGAIKQATETGNGADLVEAMKIFHAAANEYNNLAATRNNIIRQAQEQRPQPKDQQRPVAERQQDQGSEHSDNLDANAMMDAFLERVPWFKPNGKSREDRQIQALDDYVATLHEPDDPKYWQELERRVRDEFPEKFEDERPSRRQNANAREDRNVRKFPNTGGRRESRVSRGQDGRTKYTLSADQSDALEQIGLLNVDKGDKSAVARRDKILASWFKGEAA